MLKLHHIQIALLILAFTSCSENAKIEEAHANSIIVKENQEIVTMNNPSLMMGNSFGNYFQALYKTGKFKDMLKFTCRESRLKFKDDNIINFYSKMDFGFKIKLQSQTVNEDSSITLNYEVSEFATNKIKRLAVKIENDSVKLILHKEKDSLLLFQ